MNKEIENTGSNRRTILKKASFIGVGLAAPRSKILGDLDSAGTVQLIEAGINYKSLLPSSVDYRKTTFHIDVVPSHFVDEANNRIRSSRFATSQDEKALKDSQQLLWMYDGSGYRELPNEFIRRQETGWVATRLNERTRPIEALEVKDAKSPEFSIAHRDDKAVVTVEGIEQAVNSGTRETIELPSRELRIPVVDSLTESGNPKRKEVILSGSPQLIVRNYGELELYEQNNQ